MLDKLQQASNHASAIYRSRVAPHSYSDAVCISGKTLDNSVVRGSNLHVVRHDTMRHHERDSAPS